MSNCRQQPSPDGDKGEESVAGCGTTQNNHFSQRAPLPHELTAEWTVNAQLKFARAGETVEKKFSTNDAINPVRVSYKWGTVDDNATIRGQQYQNEALSQDPSKITKQAGIQKEESFRSTTSSITFGDIGRADSAFSSSNNSNKQQKNASAADIKNLETNFYGTRCQSTCNIIVTAVADFLSPADVQAIGNTEAENRENESNSFVCNTPAYTVPIQKPNSEEKKHLNVRDAVCQTNDSETKHFGQYERKKTPLERRNSRRSYGYRRNTMDNLPRKLDYISCADEVNSFMPSQIPSTIQTSKSSSTPRVSSFTGESQGANVMGSGLPAPENPTNSDPQKKPRTVHIDVYCTGSEDDEEADAESSSDSDEDDKRLDQESNSTFQTVLENEQMRLRHQRKTGSSLPRRFVDKKAVLPPNQTSDNSENISIGHALTKSSTVEEIQESKHLLFRKHVGDQQAVKLQNLRQKYQRQSSDDTLSFGYPNSSRSTVRDNTCSSISSLLAGQDVAETSKETPESEDPSYSLTKSDSFEYENALDRLRIRQMERLWSRSHSNEDEFKAQAPNKNQTGCSNLNIISEATSSQRKSPNALEFLQEETLTSKLDVVPETDNNSFYFNEQYLKSEPTPTTYDKTNYKIHQTSHFSRNKPGFLQFFGPHLEHSLATDETTSSQQSSSVPIIQNDSSLLFPNYEAGLQRCKSEKRENLSLSVISLLTPTDLSRQASPQPLSPSYNKNIQRSGSETPMSSISATTFTAPTPTPAKRFDMYNRRSPSVSETSTQPPPVGYSLEYLDKTKMFGKVVIARKPGHHVGPTKNPNCSCECCQRWLSERFQIRGRVFALGEMPVLKRPSLG